MEPSGDCLYDCLHLQLPNTAARPSALADAGAMRDAVADAMTAELLELYQMYAAAGVEGYEWMHRQAPTTLDELRTFARRRGRDAGPGDCLWADEHALSTLARLADVIFLIFDEQAVSRGSRSGRRRAAEADAIDGRFVAVGDPTAQCVVLHRSRRAHYSPVFLDGIGVIGLDALPDATRALWPTCATLGSALATPQESRDGSSTEPARGPGGNKRARKEAPARA